MNHPYQFREATISDIEILKELYKETVLTINIKDYSLEEVRDWASCGENIPHWIELINNLYFIIALNETNQAIGFASLRKDGYLHSMFVHAKFQQKGVATFLLSEIEKYAINHQIEIITSEVSLTAKSFFESKGYYIQYEQKRLANQLCLTNFVMKKHLR
ncbi:GNAT family N-acetyltransferase [Bacteroides faecichinchillae]|uniref:Putative acetyltransferase n=1 Tax=Bacteroides faecichinchillae TaxID=871325 RepID=A0A1M4WXI0_9BACE|nr:GNAT family N-acetyltransferase [Bacteroides faecichinchillae]THG68808.1 GNAT family N-acetyltransferase [Bacteroides faecichinchillae]SHE85946.1 putative acetyltransferase [Bacteroides faecichinchillae]